VNTVLEANQNSLSEKRKKSEKLFHTFTSGPVWVVMGDDAKEKSREQLWSNASSSNDFFLRT
jgi:hypothetical protein